MSSQLPPDQINILADLLGSLSRLVVKGSALTQKELEILLLGAGLESAPGYLDEIRRWGKLLSELRKWPSEEARGITVEALKLRGLPEASILLAVSTVMEGAGDSTKLFDSIKYSGKKSKSSLRVVPEKLELVLSAGEGVHSEFIVEGGPGQIVVENDQLKISPQQFGEKPTQISIIVEPFTADLLFTTLKFISSKETIEIPVIIQWDVSLTSSSPSPESENNMLNTYEAVEPACIKGFSIVTNQSQLASSVSDLLKKAGEAARIGALDKAIDILLEANRISPDNIQLHLNLASYYQTKGDFRSACVEWETALDLDPRNISVCLQLACCYNQLNRFTDAIILLETIDDSVSVGTKDRLGILRTLAMAYYNIGKHEKAIELLDKAQKIRFDSKLALLQKAWQRSANYEDTP